MKNTNLKPEVNGWAGLRYEVIFNNINVRDSDRKDTLTSNIYTISLYLVQLAMTLRHRRTSSQRCRSQAIVAAACQVPLLCKLMEFSNRLFACSAFILQSINLKLYTIKTLFTGNIQYKFRQNLANSYVASHKNVRNNRFFAASVQVI